MSPRGDILPPIEGVAPDGELGLAIAEDLPQESWEQLVQGLAGAGHRLNWWIGDALVFALDHRPHGEGYAWAVEVLGLSRGTLRNLAWVARQFPPGERIEGLTWSHHREVAHIDDEAERWAWLALAKEGERGRPLSVSDLSDEVRDPEPPDSRDIEPEADHRCCLYEWVGDHEPGPRRLGQVFWPAIAEAVA